MIGGQTRFYFIRRQSRLTPIELRFYAESIHILTWNGSASAASARRVSQWVYLCICSWCVPLRHLWPYTSAHSSEQDTAGIVLLRADMYSFFFHFHTRKHDGSFERTRCAARFKHSVRGLLGIADTCEKTILLYIQSRCSPKSGEIRTTPTVLEIESTLYEDIWRAVQLIFYNRERMYKCNCFCLCISVKYKYVLYVTTRNIDRKKIDKPLQRHRARRQPA